MGITASNNPTACQSCGCEDQTPGEPLFLGNFTSLEVLNTSQPNPEPGSYAYITNVGQSDDMAVWDSGDNVWRNIGQNNIGKPLQLFLQPGTPFNINTGVQLLNNGGPFSSMTSVTFPIRISEKECPVLFQFAETISGITKKYIYVFHGGKGPWAKYGTPVDTVQFTLIDIQGLTVDDIPADFTTELGEVPEDGFITALNSVERNLSDNTRPYYFSYYTGNILYYALFKGDPGIYGGGSVFQFNEDQFAIITDSTASEAITRTDQLENTGDGTSPYATIANLNGITIEVNQAAAEIYLKNYSGEILATVNVAFLNNEGTTFFYNESTQMLELKDDQGNVLSSVPVSAFVSNLIQHVSFNGSTPYILNFKDAENNVVDSVSFGISNIQGLQAALDGKMSISHPANTITSGSIANWNTAYGWGNHSGLYLPLGADIPDAADLNTYIQTGIYIQRFNFQAATGTNYPAPLKGFLEVMKSADGLISQKYHVGGGDSNNYYIRVFGNAWTGWKKVLDSVDITSENISNWNTAYDALGNFVDKTTDQTAIAGKKSWNGLQEYNSLSSRVFVNLQSGTGLRTFYDVTSYSSSSASVTGAIQVILPLVSNSATMWVAELTVIEYSTLALGNELSPAKFIITGYGDYLTNLSVWCSHPNRFSKVKFGRNTADDRTILIIEKYDNTFVRPKVTLDKVIYSYLDSNSALLQNPANYGINITTDVSSFVLSDTILNENFVRDNYYQSWVLANAVNRTTDQYAVNAIQGKKEWIGKQLITTRTIQKFGQNDNSIVRRLEYPAIYNSQSGGVNGNIRIELPLTTSTMWSMKVTVIEYTATSPSNAYAPAEFIITGYGNNTVANKSVWCSNPDRFTQVRFGRNTADNATVIYIDKAVAFQFPKVIIEYIDLHYNNTSSYDDAFFPITITTDNSNFVSNGTITNSNFVRDSYYDFRSYGLGISGNILFPGNDLNNVTVPNGFYAVANNFANTPISSSGALIVERYTGYITQKYQAINAGDVVRMFIRHYKTAAESWTPWREIWTSENLTSGSIANWNAAYGWGNHAGLYLKLLGNALSNGSGDVVTIESNGNIKKRTAIQVRQDGGISDSDIANWNTAYNHSQEFEEFTRELNFGSIAPASYGLADLGFEDLPLGTFVQIARLSALPTGLFLTAEVEVGNLLRIRCFNSTASTIDPSPFDLRIRITRP